MTALEADLLAFVKANTGVAPGTVLEALVAKGYQRASVRSALARLWDNGLLKLGPDRRLRLGPLIPSIEVGEP